MRLPAPFKPWAEHIAAEIAGAHVLFTTRNGGVSSGPFATLNLGRLTEDAPEAVQRNRARLQALLGARLAMTRQVHGARVLRLGAGSTPPPEVTQSGPPLELEEADGQATALRGIAPMVLTADCLPIAVAGGGAVAVLHAGWRGLAGGVIEEGVRAIRELGSGAPLQAAIGPGARVCCYEVGTEVHRQFARYGAGVRRGANLDLAAVAHHQLSASGVEAIHDVGLCTICRAEFFSHRRDRGITGRQAGVAWLT